MVRQADAGRLAALVSRPGIDPRYHVVYANVDAVRVDPEHGVFADVSFLPQEEPETALLGVPYAGNQFGFYFPLEEDDTVLVAVPEGDSNSGPVVFARIWSAADKPPAELQNGAAPEEGQFMPSPDVILRAKPGANTRILVSAGANVTITVEGGGNVNLVVNDGSVNLGADTHGVNDGVVHGSGFDPFTGQTYTALQSTSRKVFARKT